MNLSDLPYDIKLAHFRLAALEDEDFIESSAVSVFERPASCEGVIGVRHEEAVLDNEEPLLVAIAVIVEHLKVFVLNSLRDALYGKRLDVRGHAGIPEWLLLASGDVGNDY